MKNKKGFCIDCPEGSEEKFLIAKRCEIHYWKHRKKINTEKTKSKPIKKAIPKISKKKQIENLKYQVLRTEFLGKKENEICPITNKKTTEIHHKKGRVGSLFLDVRYWLAVSREGHRMIEENPEWAKKEGYSLSRLSKE